MSITASSEGSRSGHARPDCTHCIRSRVEGQRRLGEPRAFGSASVPINALIGAAAVLVAGTDRAPGPTRSCRTNRYHVISPTGPHSSTSISLRVGRCRLANVRDGCRSSSHVLPTPARRRQRADRQGAIGRVQLAALLSPPVREPYASVAAGVAAIAIGLMLRPLRRRFVVGRRGSQRPTSISPPASPSWRSRCRRFGSSASADRIGKRIAGLIQRHVDLSLKVS